MVEDLVPAPVHPLPGRFVVWVHVGGGPTDELEVAVGIGSRHELGRRRGDRLANRRGDVGLDREPDAAVRSLKTMFGAQISVAEAYADFAAFYRAVLRLDPTRILPVSFDQVTQAPEVVIAHLIRRFNLPLKPDLVSRDAVLRQMAAKEEPLAAKRRQSGVGPRDAAICAPGNAARVPEALKARAEAEIARPDVQTARIIAHGVHAQMRRAAGL